MLVEFPFFLPFRYFIIIRRSKKKITHSPWTRGRFPTSVSKNSRFPQKILRGPQKPPDIKSNNLLNAAKKSKYHSKYSGNTCLSIVGKRWNKLRTIPTASLSSRLKFSHRDKWVPVTTARGVLRLQLEKRPLVCRVAANILNKQLRTADKVWSSCLEFGRVSNNSSPLRNMNTCLRLGLILWYDISNGIGTWDSVPGMLGACIGQVHLQQHRGN
jgi:hypothetical protein